MAYPGEREYMSYMDYVVAQQEKGKKAMSKDEWKKRKMKAKKEKQKGGPKRSEPMSSILKPGSKGIIRT